MEALSHIHGGTSENNNPMLDGLWLTIIKEATPAKLSEYVEKSKKIKSHVLPKIVKKNVVDFEKSLENKIVITTLDIRDDSSESSEESFYSTTEGFLPYEEDLEPVANDEEAIAYESQVALEEEQERMFLGRFAGEVDVKDWPSKTELAFGNSPVGINTLNEILPNLCMVVGIKCSFQFRQQRDSPSFYFCRGSRSSSRPVREAVCHLRDTHAIDHQSIGKRGNRKRNEEEEFDMSSDEEEEGQEEPSNCWAEKDELKEMSFKEVTEFVKCFRNLFFVPSGRKSRFLNFLKGALNSEDSVVMPPNPTTKSWNAWFDSVLYHADYCFLFEDFERMPNVTQAHKQMENLLNYLHVNTSLEEEDLGYCFKGDFNFSSHEKKELLCLFSSAFLAAHKKLSKYVVDGAQPASKFLDQIQVLDPRNLIDVDLNFDSIDSIPGFEEVSRNEWELYVNILGPSAVKNSTDGKVDLKLFWKSKASNLPELYNLASCYCTTTIGSYDVERSFSAYKEILGEKRRSLDESSIKAFHFLNWNLRVKSSIQQEREQQSKPTTTRPETTNMADKVTPKEKTVPRDTPKEKPVPRDTPKEKPVPRDTPKEKPVPRDTPKEKPVPRDTPKEKPVPRDTPKEKPVPRDTPKEFPRLFKVAQERRQQPTPKPYLSTEKVRKRTKSDAADSSQPHKRKKISVKKSVKSADRGKLFRASLRTFLNVKPTDERSTEIGSDQSTADNTQHSPRVLPATDVHYGLLKNTATRFNAQTTCVFPEQKEPLLNCLLDGSVRFKGSSVLDEKDLQGLHGCKPRDEDKYLTNFVIEAYFDIITSTGSSKGVQAESLGWEAFEKGPAGRMSTQDLLKGKAPLMEQDVVLVPCNPGQSKHWFLLVVLPKEKEILVLDSLAGSFTKPSAENAIQKMWKLLEDVDSSLDKKQWRFYTNTPKDIPQQLNSFDCGLFICLYARCLLQSPVPYSDSHNFRRHMILELHEKELHSFTRPFVQQDRYYAVEYQKTYYFGRALGSYDGAGFVDFKFLHSTVCSGAKVFAWPRRTNDTPTFQVTFQQIEYKLGTRHEASGFQNGFPRHDGRRFMWNFSKEILHSLLFRVFSVWSKREDPQT
ncbi:hypothetical protein QZH41_002602 [Actinostola sp. cb2023]|nr:hypothetical protein QZH41_002602 [Actinostola sp. cb2023]